MIAISVLPYYVGTCESEISVRIESRIGSATTIRIESPIESGGMFIADCHVGVVYLIMCKPTTLLHATLYVLYFFGLYCRSTCKVEL